MSVTIFDVTQPQIPGDLLIIPVLVEKSNMLFGSIVSYCCLVLASSLATTFLVFVFGFVTG
jgi:hypothetical protein